MNIDLVKLLIDGGTIGLVVLGCYMIYRLFDRMYRTVSASEKARVELFVAAVREQTESLKSVSEIQRSTTVALGAVISELRQVVDDLRDLRSMETRR